MRLFVAIDIDEVIRERIARFIEGVREFVPDARWVRPESLHVTLKFIGEQSESAVEPVEQALRTIPAAAIDLHFHSHGFFPTQHAPRVFWVGVEASPSLPHLASTVDSRLAQLGVAKEKHAFNPHLTLARGGRGSGSPHKRKGDRRNSTFQCLQERFTSLPVPDFGTMTAREFFLYQSKLGREGSRYTKLAAFPLQPSTQ